MEENKNAVAVITEENEVLRDKDYAAIWSGESEALIGRDFTTYATEDFPEMLERMTGDIIKLQDAVNTTIEIENIYMENVQMADNKTGELKVLPRILLFAKDGKVYSCVSVTAFNSLTKIFKFMHMPHKGDTLKLVPKKSSNGEKQFYSFKVLNK